MFKIINYNIINSRKVLRTVRGSIKKSIFYLGAKIPYSYTNKLVTISHTELQNYLLKGGSRIKELIDLDIRIRNCDDILDNELSKIIPRPNKRIERTINIFKEQVPIAKDVAELFFLENKIISDKNTKLELKYRIKRLIEIRPSDYFALSDLIINSFGTILSKKDYKVALEFYKEFQRLRDLLDDIMSIEEDILNLSYNSIVVAKNNKIPCSFFENTIKDKFISLERLSSQLNTHPNKDIFIATVHFWKNEYELLFKKLLIDFYCSIKKFRESYFVIKQL